MRHIFRLVPVLLAVLLTNVHAFEVSRIAYHGNVSSKQAPKGYGVYQGSLFFSVADKLLRLDSVEAGPQPITLPDSMGWGLDLEATFATFDGSLFFHAERRRQNYRGAHLHRLDSRNGWPILIDVPEEMSTERWYVFNTKYADDSRSFLLHDGRLYFTARRQIPSHGENRGAYPWYSHVPFWLDSATDAPKRVFLGTYFHSGVFDLIGTDRGIGFTALYDFGLPNASARHYRLLNVPSPQVERVAAPKYEVAIARQTTNRKNTGSELVWFDHHYFFAGENLNRFPLTIYPHIGPYKKRFGCCAFKNGASAYKPDVEFFRYQPSNRDVRYYDIHSVTVSGFYGTTPLSSNPSNFVVSNGHLYFQATPDGRDLQMYELQSATSLPTIVQFADGPLYAPVPLFDFNGQLLFRAWTNTGTDLFYLAAGDRAVALGVGPAIANTARAFAQWGGALVFTARDENGAWSTYAASDQPLPRVNTPGPPIQRPPGRQPNLLVGLASVNGLTSTRPPGPVLAIGRPTTVRCEFVNSYRWPFDTSLFIAHESNFNRAPNGASSLYRECRFSRVRPGERRVCELDINVFPNTHEYTCTTKLRDVLGRPAIVGKNRAFVTGHSSAQ